MIIDAHYHLDPRMESVERLLAEGHEVIGIDCLPLLTTDVSANGSVRYPAVEPLPLTQPSIQLS